jgi:hypothetical protein
MRPTGDGTATDLGRMGDRDRSTAVIARDVLSSSDPPVQRDTKLTESNVG